jgi:hypothetical protein
MSPLQYPELLKPSLSNALHATVITASSSCSLTLPSSSMLLSSRSSSSSYIDMDADSDHDNRSLATTLSSTSSHSKSIFSPESRGMVGQYASSNQYQSTVYEAFQLQNNPAVAPLMAKAFAVNGIAHQVADNLEFRQFLLAFRSATLAPLDRRALKNSQTDLAAAMKATVIAKLQSYSKSCPISVAVDGWTNTRHHKVTNILCLCGDNAYYWCSIVNRYDSNTADWLSKPIGDTIADINNHGIRITALVADNEAVNGKLYSLLQPRFPFLLLSPCAAHTIQLCVNRSLLLPGIKEVMSTMESLLRAFRKGKHSKKYRTTLYSNQAQSGSVKCLIVPCDTRWSY